MHIIPRGGYLETHDTSGFFVVYWGFLKTFPVRDAMHG